MAKPGFPAVIQRLEDLDFHLSSSISSQYYISTYLDKKELAKWFGPKIAALLCKLQPNEGVHCVLMPHFDRPLTGQEKDIINEHDCEVACTLDELEQRN